MITEDTMLEIIDDMEKLHSAFTEYEILLSGMANPPSAAQGMILFVLLEEQNKVIGRMKESICQHCDIE